MKFNNLLIFTLLQLKKKLRIGLFLGPLVLYADIVTWTTLRHNLPKIFFKQTALFEVLHQGLRLFYTRDCTTGTFFPKIMTEKCIFLQREQNGLWISVKIQCMVYIYWKTFQILMHIFIGVLRVFYLFNFVKQ